jgi:hypothetical protein
VATAVGGTSNLTSGIGEPERVGAIRMSSNLLPMLGIQAFRGRRLSAADDIPGRAPVALLSYGMWIRRYGGDRAIVGKSVHLNGPYEVAGVLPREFTLPREAPPELGGAEQADIVFPLRSTRRPVRSRFIP